MPDAEIIAVGSELLTPQRLDTNSLYLTDQLNALGVEVVRKTVVGDERERLTDSILGAAARSQIVVLTGGLGPTEDDLTRDAVASALGRTLVFQQDICDRIEGRLRFFGRKMAEINRRQAYVIEGAEVLPNERGTAPGQWIANDGVVFMLLPRSAHGNEADVRRALLAAARKTTAAASDSDALAAHGGDGGIRPGSIDLAHLHEIRESGDYNPGRVRRNSRASARALCVRTKRPRRWWRRPALRSSRCWAIACIRATAIRSKR